MTFLKALILGLIQGLTEFIPVSSSGHLIVAQTFLGQPDRLFMQFVDIGTLIALLIYFRHKIYAIVTDIVKKHHYKLALNLLITSIPAGIIGFLLAGFIDSSWFFSSISVTSIALGAIGVIMINIAKLPKQSKIRRMEHLPYLRALNIGLAQMLALIPGVSRSGATIIVGRMSGLSSTDAAQYSFLASIPIMCGMVLRLFINATARTYFMHNIGLIIVANVVAFVVGWLAIGWLLKFLKRRDSLRTFGWYRVAMAFVLLAINA